MHMCVFLDAFFKKSIKVTKQMIAQASEGSKSSFGFDVMINCNKLTLFELLYTNVSYACWKAL